MKRAVSTGILVVLGVLAACGGRPGGEVLEDPVQITATASVDGVPLLPGGATNSIQILIEGSMTTMHGIESSTYSWNGGDPIPLELNDVGAFSVNLDLVAGEGVLVLEGTPLVEGESSTLSMSFILDQVGPTLTLPEASFAATIVSEDGMTLDLQPTSFALSNGTPVPMVSGVAFAKYSTTYGDGQQNLPTWRFQLSDNLPLDDATVEFRVLKEGEELVPWTLAAEGGGENEYEATITSAQHSLIGTDSGDYVIEVQAFDGANNKSEVSTLSWSQVILPPPVFLAVGDESTTGGAGGVRDPRSYQIAINLSDMTRTVAESIVVGSVRVGNPNPVPVLVHLNTESFEPLASFRTFRSSVLIGPSLAALPASSIVNCPDVEPFDGGLGDRLFGGACFPHALGENKITRRPDLSNTRLLFEFQDAAGSPLSSLADGSFVVPPNTEVHALATLPNPVGNFQPNIHEGGIGVFGGGTELAFSTLEELESYYVCTTSHVSGPVTACDEWSQRRVAADVRKLFATWDFSASADSKVTLVVDDEYAFVPVTDVVVGYSRALGTSLAGPSDAPTNHDSF